MGIIGMGNSVNVQRGVGNVMNVATVNAGQVQATVLTLLAMAYKQNCKYMVNDASCNIRLGFSVERLPHPYNTTIPIIHRYPDVSQGYIDLSANQTAWGQIFANSVSSIKDGVTFSKAFEVIEAQMVASNINEMVVYGVRVVKIPTNEGTRFSYELEPSLAISFKNDLKF